LQDIGAYFEISNAAVFQASLRLLLKSKEDSEIRTLIEGASTNSGVLKIETSAFCSLLPIQSQRQV
jgi:hypothetical protein